MVLSNAEAHSTATGNATLETEFGASMDLTALNQQLGQYDQAMIPWMFWSYTRYIDPYTDSSQTALKPPTLANVNQAMLTTLARPYPQLVAGTPNGWAFDPNTKIFTLKYSTKRADGHGRFPPGSETDIAVPALRYPHGYLATVVGGAVASAPNAPVLRVDAGDGSGPITVSVAPVA